MSSLSSREAALARRLRVAARRGFIGERVVLHRVIGRYLIDSPACAGFAADHSAFMQRSRPPGVRFSLVRSWSIVLIRVAREAASGVRVERVRPMTDIRALREGQLTSGELAQAQSRPPGEQLTADLWFRAGMRAMGTSAAAEPYRLSFTTVTEETL